ncbi:KR-domain-containing protein [Nemania serpens]|nr:KR-domain-containing protein [Nemania serpens]
MTYEDWLIGVNSKASGFWNLHTALPSGLDFFVILSSLNGIVGGRAQANYAAGNTYKDSLAHFRVSLGEKAVSIDPGVMYCDDKLLLLTHDQVQVLVGLETPEAVRAKGIELQHAIHRPLFRQMFYIDRPVHTYGMNSLVAVDQKNWFSREIGADIQVFLLLSNKSLDAVR